MKKIYSIVICLLIVAMSGLSQDVFADECSKTCAIADAPAPALSEYLTNLDTAIQNLSESITTKLPESDSGKISGTAQATKNALLRTMNSYLSYARHYGEFDYKIGYRLTHEIPSQADRDMAALQNMSDRLENLIQYVYEAGSSKATIQNPCKSVEYCSLPAGKNVLALAGSLLKNNERIIGIYQNSVTGSSQSTPSGLILVSPDFLAQIASHYTPETLQGCQQCDGALQESVRESIQKISFDSSDIRKGIQKWKNAWYTIRSGTGIEQQNQALSNYLGNAGVNGGQADALMDNLRRYEAGGLSTSNPLQNSLFYTQSQIRPEIDSAAASFYELFSELKNLRPTVPIGEFVRVNSGIETSGEISSRIADLYDSQLPYSLSQDVATQTLQTRILNMHSSLIQSINTLQGKQKIAEKLCNKQGTGDGRCTYD